MRIISLLKLMVLLLSCPAIAGRVRTLPTSSQEMPIIYLMTGRSTVLRFSSPPKKVVIGNQNYFNIEFIDSDVTLQPLAITTSNMFVYGDGFTYGFILKVDHSSNYDDLVFIKHKVINFTEKTLEKSASKLPVNKPDLRFLIKLPKNSKLHLQDGVFKWSEAIKSYYADLYITSKVPKEISSDQVKIQLFNGKEDLTTIKAVFEKEKLVLNSPNRVRLFARIKPKQDLKLKIQTVKEEIIFDLKWKK